MLGKPPSYLPQSDVALYRALTILLYLWFFAILVYGALTFFFPYQRYSFDFTNPDAAKNTLFEPHTTNFSAVEKGTIPPGERLTVYANNPQVLEAGDITITPEDTPDLTGTEVLVRRGFAATFFPVATPLDIPQKTLVEYQGNFYEQKETTLYPFVSSAAAESHLPKNRIGSLSPEAFAQLSLSDEILGFRPGTLLAYADGVFFVTEEGTIRPFGSAEVLLRSGYTFDHVLPASGEEAGIYKRGKIILPGELHLGGTLFEDTETQQTYLFQEKKLWPLTSTYAEFLKTHTDVISFSGSTRETLSSCTLTKNLLQKSYSCHFSTLPLQGTGNDYQITLTSFNQPVDIYTLKAGLQSSRQNENARATLRSLVNRLLERVGLY